MAPSKCQPLAEVPIIPTKSSSTQAEAQVSYVAATKKCTPCHTIKPLYMFFSEPQGDIAIGKICYICRLKPQLRRFCENAATGSYKVKAEVRTEAIEFASGKIDKWHVNVDAVGLSGLVNDRQALLEFCTTKIDTHITNPAIATPTPKPSKLKRTFPTSKTASASNKRAKTGPIPSITSVPKTAVPPKQKQNSTAATSRPRRSIAPAPNNSNANPATPKPDFSHFTGSDVRARVAANRARLASLTSASTSSTSTFGAKRQRLVTATAEHATLSTEAERRLTEVEDAKKKQQTAIDAYNDVARRCNALKEELEALDEEIEGGSGEGTDGEEMEVEVDVEIKMLYEEQETLKERFKEIAREKIEKMFV